MKKIFVNCLIIFSFFGCNFEKEKKISSISEENFFKQNNFSLKKTKEKIIKLDKKLKETSGLLYLNGEIWTFNDSSGKTELYQIDKNSGKILKTKKILNAKNIDWEDITQSEKYIFIGDIGNNKGKRKKIQIYKISKKNFLKKDELKAEKLEFFYPNKEKITHPLTPSLKLREGGGSKLKFLEKINFSKLDSEALFYYKKNLYIFSKGWKDFNVKIFKLDLKTKKIKKIGEKNLGGLITGATFYDNKIFLVGYNDIFVSNPFLVILENFEKENFFSGKITRKNIFSSYKSAQIEGIAIGNGKIFLSAEKEKYATINKQSLIILDLKDFSN